MKTLLANNHHHIADIELLPSKYWLLANIVFYVCLVIAIGSVSFSVGLKILLYFVVIVCGANFYFHWQASHVRIFPRHGSWLVRSKAGLDRELIGCHFWSRWLLIIIVRGRPNDSGRTVDHYLPIFPDSCHKLAFHHLCVVCRFGINATD